MFSGLDGKHKIVVLEDLAAWFGINYLSEIVIFKIILE
jgi:hypothetical protein